jgi:hypothetical protein
MLSLILCVWVTPKSLRVFLCVLISRFLFVCLDWVKAPESLIVAMAKDPELSCTEVGVNV